MSDEESNKVADLSHGEIVIPRLGNPFKLLFYSGQVFLSNDGTVAYAELALEGFDYDFEEKEYSRIQDRKFREAALASVAEKYGHPETIKDIFHDGKADIFYSCTPTLDIVTFPHIGSDEVTQAGGIVGNILNPESREGHIRTQQDFANLHYEETKYRNLVDIRDDVVRNPEILVDKVNEFYSHWVDFEL